MRAEGTLRGAVASANFLLASAIAAASAGRGGRGVADEASARRGSRVAGAPARESARVAFEVPTLVSSMVRRSTYAHITNGKSDGMC